MTDASIAADVATGAELARATDADGITTLTLARPRVHNALSPELIDALHGAITDAAADTATRLVVLAGQGASFCAGGDLNWMRTQIDADRAQRMREAQRLADMLSAINASPKPTIARVQGNAFGGGIGLMAVCDHVVSVDTARFGFTETGLGIIPATIGPHVIARMGEGAARRVFMSGRLFDAHEAARLGLVETIVSADDLDGAVTATAKPYLGVSPTAVTMAKDLARHLGGGATEAAIAHSIEKLADAWETPDARARIAAFLARKKS
ncbi:MAG: enoyl-CoA hydratase-related protein [Pseudomonadota bacterium]